MKRGVNLSTQKARRVTPDDFQAFDYIIAMDSSNYDDLSLSCPPGHESKLRLLMEFAPDIEANEVPDPYYGGATGFERVLDLIEQASAGLLAYLRQQHKL
jgi:protein-tyrosine phosphatase